MGVRKNLLLDDDAYTLGQEIAEKENTTFTDVVNSAIKYYSNYKFMDENAVFINTEIKQAIKASMDMLEHKINIKTNKVLSEVAIQLACINMAIAHNIEITPEQLDKYRVLAVEFLKANNRVLRLDEIIEDA